ncbi:MAG: hypothetical protein QOE00_2783 [Ilumatobacteraceae bacterium]
MRKLWLTAAFAALATAFMVGPAGAITGGVVDGNGHPNVGGLVNDTQYSDGTWIYCSGTLISSTVFLTAAHCGDDNTRVRVTFDTAYQAGDPIVSGTFHADPLYSQVQSDPHDIAVVTLDKPIKNIQPAVLPNAGAFSKLSSTQTFTAVGYGAHDVINAPGGKVYLYDDVRMVAVGTLNSTNPSWLRISMNEALGNGGTCYGDSGGPNFLGSSTILAATTITGDAVCRATNVVYRLDTPAARAFLAHFVRLP